MSTPDQDRYASADFLQVGVVTSPHQCGRVVPTPDQDKYGSADLLQLGIVSSPYRCGGVVSTPDQNKYGYSTPSLLPVGEIVLVLFLVLVPVLVLVRWVPVGASSCR